MQSGNKKMGELSAGVAENAANELRQQLTSLTDLSVPASWYPAARKLKRTIIAHLGPTNSGKTHQALEALKTARSGAYCGPLRLLAWEVAEKMNVAGVPFNLITGQEQKILEGAKHTASTVEMANVSHSVEVGVVDEVQMVQDPVRGSSFTRAILGLPVQTLHLCGDPAVLPLLQLLARDTGDKLEVQTYERLAPLSASKRALSSLETASRGDCLIAFSRREVHSIKRRVEEAGRHSCCMVYGALPPESRAHQADLFNRARTGYNVLAASDAIGMGLNLNVRRIIFTSLEKFDGVEQRCLTPAEIKQIAGRAGRFGSKYDAGIVTCLNTADLQYLQVALAAASPLVKRACLLPRFEQISFFMHQNPHHDLPSALQAFSDRATLADHYFLGDSHNMLQLAMMLRHLSLNHWEHFTFSSSPADSTDTPVASALLSLATAYSMRSAPETEGQLQHLEALHRVYDLYIWLALRLEDAFTDRQLIEERRVQCSEAIQQGLDNLSSRGKSWHRRARKQSLTSTEFGKRPYSTGGAYSGIRHFPKHLLKRRGDALRPPLALNDVRGADDEDLDPKAPLVKPERPRETRSQRRVRKREEGVTRVIERDFGKGILPPFSDEEEEPAVLVPQYGPGMQPKRRKQGAKRKSSMPAPYPQS